MKIPDATVDREILESGLEDTTGIFEIIWRLNTVFPSASLADKYDAADRRVRELIRSGHIRLVRHYFCKTDRIEPIHDADIDAILRSPTAWYPSDSCTDDASRISYDATDSSQQLYDQLYLQSKTVA